MSLGPSSTMIGRAEELKAERGGWWRWWRWWRWVEKRSEGEGVISCGGGKSNMLISSEMEGDIHS